MAGRPSNPFPDKERESKTWLTEEAGPIVSIAQLLDQAAYFRLNSVDAEAIVAEAAHVLRATRPCGESRHRARVREPHRAARLRHSHPGSARS
jgi:hypothetical protein